MNVFEADLDLAEGLSMHRCPPPLVRQIVIDPGPWDPSAEGAGSAFGLLTVSGFLVRRVELAGRRSAELLGQGDLLRPLEIETDPWAMVPSSATWSALDTVRLAALDARFASWCAGHPEVVSRLCSRILRRSRTLALRLALVQLPRVSARLHFLLWHLADRFGRISREGVSLLVPLNHSLLADLVSAARPTVTLALGRT